MKCLLVGFCILPILTIMGQSTTVPPDMTSSKAPSSATTTSVTAISDSSTVDYSSSSSMSANSETEGGTYENSRTTQSMTTFNDGPRLSSSVGLLFSSVLLMALYSELH